MRIFGTAALAIHFGFTFFALLLFFGGVNEWRKRRLGRAAILMVVFGPTSVFSVAQNVSLVRHRSAFRSLQAGNLEWIEVGGTQYSDTLQIQKITEALHNADWFYGTNTGPDSIGLTIKTQTGTEALYTVQASITRAGDGFVRYGQRHSGTSVYSPGGILYVRDMGRALADIGVTLPTGTTPRK